jgi:hypothetical protein
MFVVATTIDLLLGPLSITISDTGPCRSIGGRSRNCRGVDIDRPLLLRLVVVVGVINDDYLAVTRRHEDATVEVAKKFSSELLVMRVSITSEEKPLTGVAPEAPPCSNTEEQWRRDETSDGDPGGGGDPDGTGIGDFASSSRGLPSAEGGRSRLMPFLPSIGG